MFDVEEGRGGMKGKNPERARQAVSSKPWISSGRGRETPAKTSKMMLTVLGEESSKGGATVTCDMEVLE